MPHGLSTRMLRHRIAAGQFPAYRQGPRIICLDLADVDRVRVPVPHDDVAEKLWGLRSRRWPTFTEALVCLLRDRPLLPRWLGGWLDWQGVPNCL